ncbi:unnamed protein product [Anisakis simplex]|uniref:Uncharacterized protein n=1 Tax=Anisakis simplex TaxID=6269 RepID=A0A0M3KFT8_ANISI|nr:unnamed protein product [Anisakis simplex]
MPLLRNSSSSAGGPQGPAPAGPINPAFSHFQSAIRQQSLSGRPSPVPQLALASAAKNPLTVQNNPPKSVSSGSSSGGSLSAAPSNSIGPNRTAVRQNLGSSSGQSKFGSASTTAPSFVDRERVTNTTSYLPTRFIDSLFGFIISI